MKEDKVEYGELEDSYEPPDFTYEYAKGGGESTREGDIIPCKWVVAQTMKRVC